LALAATNSKWHTVPGGYFIRLFLGWRSKRRDSVGALINMLKGPNQENTGGSQYTKNLPRLSCFSGVIVHNPSCVLENVSCKFIRNKEEREYSWHVLCEPNSS